MMQRLSLMRWLAALLLSVGLFGSALASVDTYAFKDEAERARYRSLIEELRCPKCQNQNISDSDAPIAMDLRREIYRMLEDGRSNEEIVNYLVDRYGEFVRYKPVLNSRTWFLWYGPWLLLGAGFAVLGLIVWRRRRIVPVSRSTGATKVDTLSPEERVRLNQLLNDKANPQ